ncbi:hypothetical protein MRX96_037402 [Rhipicephalus microplus]
MTAVPAKPASPVAPKKSMIQAEANESKLGGSTESHVITLSEKLYYFLLQSLNLPIYSKTNHHADAGTANASKCICQYSKGCCLLYQEQTPEQPTTTVLVATEVATILTPTYHWIIEQLPRGAVGTWWHRRCVNGFGSPSHSLLTDV